MIYILKPVEFLKAVSHKYIRRWKGKDGKWEYAYPGDNMNRRRVAGEKVPTGSRQGAAPEAPARREPAKGGEAPAQAVENENRKAAAHSGTLKGVTQEHVKELMKHFARRPKGMGKEKTIQTRQDLEIILTHTTFAMMSAGRNPNNAEDMKLTDAQIKERHGKLLARLREEGFIYTQCHGKYVNPEESVMVMMHDADRDMAMQIGGEFNQDSIVFTVKGKNELIYTTGEKKGKADMAGEGFEEVPKATDFYTKMPLSTGETIKFTLMLDDVEKALMELAGIMGISRYRLFLYKSKKMPIGTISHGRKKVADGKWVDVPKDQKKTAVKKTGLPKSAKDKNYRTLDYGNPLDYTAKDYSDAAARGAIGRAKTLNRGIAKMQHRYAAKKAFEEGKKLPDHILIDYPDLVSKNKGVSGEGK